MSSDGSVNRPKWRDAIKASPLSPKARAVALTMADFWPKEPGAPMWCAVETLIEHTGYSRASIYRAIEELMEYGYLRRVDKARQHRSPRYHPETPGKAAIAATSAAREAARGLRLRSQRSHSENPGVSRRRGTLNEDTTVDSTVGSGDLDCESRPASAGERKQPNYSPMPITTKDKADHRLLAEYMANYTKESVDIVWEAFRSGRLGWRQRHPGALAADAWDKPTGEPGVNEWQGMFRRFFLTDQPDAQLPTRRAADGDPWAA